MTWYRDSDFAKQAFEAFKQLEKKHKRVSVNSMNAKLIEDNLTTYDSCLRKKLRGHSVSSVQFCRVLLGQAISDTREQALKVLIRGIDAEKLLKIKGVLEPTQDGGKLFENKKEELDHQLSVGSSYLLDQLNNEEVEKLNSYLHENEKIFDITLDAQTINYRDVLLENFKEFQDPFGTEFVDVQYDQNPADPSQVVRNITFKEKQ